MSPAGNDTDVTARTRRRRAAAVLCAMLGVIGIGIGSSGVGAAQRSGSDESRAHHKAPMPRAAKRGSEVMTAAQPPRSKLVKANEDESPAPDIVGGTIAPAGAYPFFVSVKRASDNFAFCGATLVSSVWVLTAAHCVDGGTTAASLKLVIGANQLNNEAPGDIRSVTAIHLHPSWNPSTFDNDVAMLRLNTASTKAWARMAEPVDPVNPGNTVRAIGHGHTTQGGVASNDLRQVDLPVQSDATMSAAAQYGGSFHGAVMIGAGPLAGGQDTCQGDSGGPLFIAGGQVRLVGDTSWGSGCAQPNKPGIYGEVYQGALRTFVNGLVGRPSNDNFAGSGISGADGTVVGSNTDSTGQTGEPSIAGSIPDTSVWYSWTAPENGTTTMNTRDAAFDTTLQVFTGSSLTGLTSVASNDDFNGTLQSRLSFNAVAGTTYRIAVDGFGAAHGSFGLQWAQNPPANDQFATPATISGATGKVFGSNARSTGEPGEPNHGSIPDRSVWYSWTAPESGSAVLHTRESNFDTVLAVYTGTSITGLTQLASNDQFNGTNQSKVTLPVTAGTTYRIAVDGFGATTGTIGLQWSINPPANDNFASGRVLPGLDGITGATTVRATGEPGELDFHGGAAADNSAWFRWTPSQSGPARLRMTNISSGFAPGIEVYTGTSVGALTTIAEGSTSAALNVVAGTLYHIAVDGNGGSTGAFRLDWALTRCNGLDATIVGTGNITGTAGNDVIVGSATNDTIDGAGGNDTICGLRGNDSITGGLGNDHERGGLGNDTFHQGSVVDGADHLDGEGGVDVANYGSRTGAALLVSLNNAAGDGASGEGDNVLRTVENVTGGSGNDRLSGSPAVNGEVNVLTGNGGNDILRGGGGNDTLIGNAGADQLFGDANNDTLNLVDGVGGNDTGDGGAGADSATLDSGDTVINVP
jgi:secreted trypsin-like serine protease